MCSDKGVLPTVSKRVVLCSWASGNCLWIVARSLAITHEQDLRTIHALHAEMEGVTAAARRLARQRLEHAELMDGYPRQVHQLSIMSLYLCIHACTW